MGYEDSEQYKPSAAIHESAKPPDHHEADTFVSPLSPALTYFGLGGALPSIKDGQEDNLMAMLNHLEWAVRVAALRRLEHLQIEVPLESILAAQKDDHPAVRAAAIRMLGSLGIKAPIDPLITALHDPAWVVRSEALLVLGQQSERTPVESLLTALSDEDESVRAMAVWAVGMLKERAPIELLMEALHDQDWTVREAAELALNERGAHVPSELHVVHEATPQPLERIATPSTSIEDVFSRSKEEVDNIPSYERPWYSRVEIDDDPIGYDRRDTKRTSNDELDENTEPLYFEHGDRQRRARISTNGDKIIQPTAQKRDVGPSQRTISTKRSSRWRMIERGLVAALIVGIGLGWLLLSQSINTTTSSASTSFSYHDTSGEVFGAVWMSYTTSAPNKDKTLIAFADTTGKVQIWDTITKQLVTEYGPFNKVLAIAYSTHGLYIAALDVHGSLLLMKAGDPKPLLSLPGSLGLTPVVVWAPDGSRLAIALNTKTDHTVQVWNITAHQRITVHHGRAGSITAIAWSQDGTNIATASDDGKMRMIELWDATTGKPVLHSLPLPYVPVPSRVVSMTWSADGTHLAYALNDGEVRVWDDRTYNHTLFAMYTASYSFNRPRTASDAKEVLAWSPNGQYLASATTSGSIQVWDKVTGNLLYTYRGHSEQINDIVWSPDGKHIASLSIDGSVLVWGMNEN